MNKMEMVLFCRVAWMKRYQGITEDDKPVNGGAFVKKNEDAHESNNFRPYNHHCRGFVEIRNQRFNIERFTQEKGMGDEVHGVTVIFVATHPNGVSYIVGWYKNATVYRYGKLSYEGVRHDGSPQFYWFEAKEEDCVLIPESQRRYVIPSATQAGKGRGMGQSNIWFADAPEAANVRINALRFINEYSGPRERIYYTAEELTKCAADHGKGVDKLIELGKNVPDPYEALTYANLALKKERSFETYRLRAAILWEMFCDDEAEAEYRRALYEEPENIEVMVKLQSIELTRENFGLSIEMGNRLLGLLDDGEAKCNIVLDMVLSWLMLGNPDKAEELLKEHEALCRQYQPESVDGWFEDIHASQRNGK